MMSSTPTREYGYDDNGNRTQYWESGTLVASGTYDDQDRILTYGGTTYTHDHRGQITAKANGPSSWSFAYDDYGQLVEVTRPNSDVVTYRTDGRDRRVRRLSASPPSAASVTDTWVYRDQLRLAAEVSGSTTGDVDGRYVNVLGVNVPDLILEGSTVKRLITDHLGTVRMVVDVEAASPASAILERYAYDEFGVRQPGSDVPTQPFGFAGGLYDHDTGLVRFGAREYDPQIGRWLSKDPILFDGGSNLLFSYVSSNPLNLRDESGLSDPCPPHPPPDPEKEKREQCYRSCQVNYVNCVNTNGPNFPCGKIRQDCRDECDIQHGKPYRRPEDCPEDMCQ